MYSADGERVGSVRHVLAAGEEDIFDGLVLDSRLAPTRHRFVDAAHVEAIHEQGVTLSVDAPGFGSLPEPSPNPGAIDSGPEATVPDDLADKLRRAWERISGKG